MENQIFLTDSSTSLSSSPWPSLKICRERLTAYEVSNFLITIPKPPKIFAFSVCPKNGICLINEGFKFQLTPVRLVQVHSVPVGTATNQGLLKLNKPCFAGWVRETPTKFDGLERVAPSDLPNSWGPQSYKGVFFFNFFTPPANSPRDTSTTPFPSLGFNEVIVIVNKRYPYHFTYFQHSLSLTIKQRVPHSNLWSDYSDKDYLHYYIDQPNSIHHP